MREGYPRLVPHTDGGPCLASRIYEICEFVHDVVRPERLDARFHHKVSIHNSCHGVRLMGLQYAQRAEHALSVEAARPALAGRGASTSPSRRACDECCGFGGMFAVEEKAVSVCMGRDKVRDHMATGAEYITGADSSCLMHMQGVIDRRTAADHDPAYR